MGVLCGCPSEGFDLPPPDVAGGARERVRPKRRLLRLRRHDRPRSRDPTDALHSRIAFEIGRGAHGPSSLVYSAYARSGTTLDRLGSNSRLTQAGGTASFAKLWYAAAN